MDKKEKEEKQKFYVVGYGKAEKVSEEVFKKEMAEEKEKEKKCTICNDKEVLLHAEIGVFRGILCPRCYMVKMLKEICGKLGIKDNSFWLKRE